MATPASFYARFGVVDWFAISITIFVVVLHLLFAFGLYFRGKPAYHTQVPMKGTFADRIGAFWLMACAFGPLIGWLITVIGITETTWRWQYLARAFFAAVLPVITAAPLLHYARGKAALVAIPLLIIVTALPITSCLWVIGDLHDGAQNVLVEVLADGREGQANCKAVNKRYDDLPCKELKPARLGEKFEVSWLPHTRPSYQNGLSRPND